MPRPKKDAPHTCDAPEKVALCLTCERPYCPGSCAQTNAPSGARRQGGKPANTALRARFLELYEQGWTDQEIARAVAASASTVQRYRSKLELKPNLRRRGQNEAIA